MIKFTTAQILATITLLVIYSMLISFVIGLVGSHGFALQALLWGIWVSGYVLGQIIHSVKRSHDL